MNKTSDFHREQYNNKYRQSALTPSPYFEQQFNYLLRWSGINPANIRILDLGCGTGEYSIILQGMGFDVTSVDISPVAIEKAKLVGVKKAVCADFLHDSIDEKFDLVFVKGFSPLNVSNMEEFNHVVSLIDRLLSTDGTFFYWGSTDFSGLWSRSGWYNWKPEKLDELFEWQVHLAFRWQSFLPVFLNDLISEIMSSLSLPKKSNTFIGWRKSQG